MTRDHKIEDFQRLIHFLELEIDRVLPICYIDDLNYVTLQGSDQDENRFVKIILHLTDDNTLTVLHMEFESIREDIAKYALNIIVDIARTLRYKYLYVNNQKPQFDFSDTFMQLKFKRMPWTDSQLWLMELEETGNFPLSQHALVKAYYSDVEVLSFIPYEGFLYVWYSSTVDRWDIVDGQVHVEMAHGVIKSKPETLSHIVSGDVEKFLSLIGVSGI